MTVEGGYLGHKLNQIAMEQMQAPHSRVVRATAAVRNLGLMIASAPLALLAGGGIARKRSFAGRHFAYYSKVGLAARFNLQHALRPTRNPDVLTLGWRATNTGDAKPSIATWSLAK